MSAPDLRNILNPATVYQQTFLKPVDKKLARKLVNIQPSSNSSMTITSAAQNIQFQLQGDARVSGMRLRFNATATGSGGTYCRFVSDLRASVQQLLLTIGGNEVWNMVANAGDFITAETQVNCNLQFLRDKGQLAGIYNPVARNAFASAGQQYEFDLDFGGLLDIPLPLPLMSQPVNIQITLKPAVGVLESDHTASTLSYSLTNIQLICDCIEESDQARAEMKAELQRTGQFLIPFKFIYSESQNVSASQTQINYPIQARGTVLDKVLIYLRNAADVNNPTVNDYYSTFPYSNTTDWVFQLNGSIVPQQAINCQNSAAESLTLLLEAYDNNDPETGIESGPLILAEDYVNDKFIVCYGFGSPLNPRQAALNPAIISGVNISAAGSNFMYQSNKSAVATQYTLFVFSYCWAVLAIRADGTAYVSK